MLTPHYTTILAQESDKGLELNRTMDAVNYRLAQGTQGTPTENPDARYALMSVSLDPQLIPGAHQRDVATQGRILGDNVSDRMYSNGTDDNTRLATAMALQSTYQIPTLLYGCQR